MRSILCGIEILQLVLIDRRGGNDDNTGILGLGSRVLDDLLKVLFVGCEGNVLDMGRHTGVICSEEDSLASLAVKYSRVLGSVGRSYHEPDIGDLWRGEHLREDIDGMSGRIASVVGVVR